MRTAGRAQDTVAAALDDARENGPVVLHLAGPRGSGRTWLLDLAADRCRRLGRVELRGRGRRAGSVAAFDGVRQLLPEWSPDDDPAVTLLELATRQPVALLIDDVDLMDADSVTVLTSVARSVGAESSMVVVSTGLGECPWRTSWSGGDPIIRLAAMPDSAVTSMLVTRGVAAAAARRCAEIAMGNPGLAVAVADGLTADQREGRSPLVLPPRPVGGLADDLRLRLAEHGDRIGRALVVAASEPGGDIEAVRAALAALGEPNDSLDAAEAAGLVELAGTRLGFADPWIALVAPSLVAPASRRAAHRALAAALSRPDQAAARAWQLAAGADGPSDDVADALGLVAADAANRGALHSAIGTAERAAQLAGDDKGRAVHLDAALGWTLDAADGEAARRVRAALVATGVDHRDALVEAAAFLDGPPPGAETTDDAPDRDANTWRVRRARRLAVADALERGEHASVFPLVDRSTLDPLGDNVSIVHALRHRGDIRQARSALLASTIGEALADPDHRLAADSPYGHWYALLLAADLAILAGRGNDAAHALEVNAALLPTLLTDWARVLTARAALQSDPVADPASAPDAFTPLGGGTLFHVRHLVAQAVLHGDRATLDEAIATAEAARLAVEVAEARLWAAAASDESGSNRSRSAAGALQRCGIRGWDHRLEAMTGRRSAPVVVARAADPEIDGLSPAERRVADAVASGLTNRETAAALIVSVKTVDFHLQQIYRKLGIRSRTELTIRMMNSTDATRRDGA